MQGIVVVNKKSGVTSRDVVNSLCKIFNTKKVGHTGTLDPMAQGVLIVCFGRYTKLVDYITSANKKYIASVKFGILTDTLDVTGKVLSTENFEINEDKIKKSLKKFEKSYMQEPPMYSAIKINGKKLYEYARNNEKVEIPKRSVTIYKNELLELFDDGFSFKTFVSKGTYVRSLIIDIARDLSTVGVMSDLSRVSQGKINIENSYTLEQIENGEYKTLFAKDVLECEMINLTEEETNNVLNGVKLKKDVRDDLYLLIYEKEEIALYEFMGGIGKMKVLLKV